MVDVLFCFDVFEKLVFILFLVINGECIVVGKDLLGVVLFIVVKLG